MNELWLFFRNVFFTIVQPGLVVGLLPYLLLRGRLSWAPVGLRIPGLALVVVGCSILFYCIYHFQTIGRGTLSPLDPTRHLVTKGLYRYTRNPMYMGILLVLIGESACFQSTTLFIYTVFVFLAFHVFIIVHEEPRLQRAFGDEYSVYRKRVRRWI